jgi:uncharacterized membrane-anchored protein
VTRTVLILGGLALVLGSTWSQIAGKQRLLREGTTMLVELAPVDPRSLIQGDYMRLDYAIARNAPGTWVPDGAIVVALDAAGVARFLRVHAADALQPGEHLLRYRSRRGRVRIGTDAFYFQEGHAPRYQSARFGELRVDADGNSLLVGLRDAERRSLGNDQGQSR